MKIKDAYKTAAEMLDSAYKNFIVKYHETAGDIEASLGGFPGERMMYLKLAKEAERLSKNRGTSFRDEYHALKQEYKTARQEDTAKPLPTAIKAGLATSVFALPLIASGCSYIGKTVVYGPDGKVITESRGVIQGGAYYYKKDKDGNETRAGIERPVKIFPDPYLWGRYYYYGWYPRYYPHVRIYAPYRTRYRW